MQQRRKIRYLIAFVLLIAGIFVLLFCNIGIGTVKIPLAEILTTGRATGRHERKDPVGDPFSPDTGGSNSGRSTGTGRVSASDIFPQSHSRPFCTGNFFRGEDGSGTGDGIFAGEYDPGQLRTADPGGISGCYAVHGICASYGAKGGQYVHVGGQRCDDRLHLFRHHGTGGDVCGGRGHREPPQLVQRKLFRNDLGQCESDERRGGGGFLCW